MKIFFRWLVILLMVAGLAYSIYAFHEILMIGALALFICYPPLGIVTSILILTGIVKFLAWLFTD